MLWILVLTTLLWVVTRKVFQRWSKKRYLAGVWVARKEWSHFRRLSEVSAALPEYEDAMPILGHLTQVGDDSAGDISPQ